MWDWYNWYKVTDQALEAQLKDIVDEFPSLYAKARVMWVQYQFALDHGLLTSAEQRDLEDWFAGVLDIWDKIGVNWAFNVGQKTVSPRRLAFANEVDDWVTSVRGYSATDQLGFVISTGIVVGLVAISVATTAVAWAFARSADVTISQLAHQTALLDARTAGTIEKSEYASGMQAAKQIVASSGSPLDILGSIGNIGKLAATGAVLYFGWPIIQPLIKKIGAKLSG